MKKIFKCKNLFLVTFLAIAGFFSAAAIITTKQSKDNPTVEVAKASTGSEHKIKLITPPNDWWDDGNCSTQIYFYAIGDVNGAKNSYFGESGQYNSIIFNNTGSSWCYQEFDLGSKTISEVMTGDIWIKRRNGDTTTHQLKLNDRPNVYNSLKNGQSNTICIYATSGTSNYWINDGSDGFAFMSNYVISLNTSSSSSWSSGTGYSSQCAYIYNTSYTAPSNLGTLPTGYILTSWRINSVNGNVWSDGVPTADVDLYAYYCMIGSEGHGRIWFNRNGHYMTGWIWHLWDGVTDSKVYEPSYHGEYLYYDIGIDLLKGKYIVFQIYNTTSKKDDASTVSNEFCYSSGDNANLLYPYHDGSWHIGKSTVSGLSKSIGTDIFNDVLYPYLTCSSNSDYGYGNISQLYKTWVWTGSASNIYGCSSEAECMNALAGHTLSYSDYGYTVGPGGISYNYSDSNNRSIASLSALAKFTALMNMSSSGNPNHASVREFNPYTVFVGTDNDAAVILIIVVSSISILSITALSVLMVKKRKSKQD